MINTLTLILLEIGAIASGVFVLDYLRTANTKNLWTRQVLALNAAISVVLIVAIMRRLAVLPDHYAWFYAQLISLVVIDAALIYQTVLLRRSRKGDGSRSRRIDD